MLVAFSLAVALQSAPFKLWVYFPSNFLVDANADKGIALLERAKQAGYSGFMIADSKFWRFKDMPDRYFANLNRFRARAKALGIDVVACVAPIGYANDMLSQNPDLAEALPVRNAPFVVASDGTIVPEPDGVSLKNGDFESKSDGWAWMDQPGVICAIDEAVKAQGNASLRMSNIKEKSESGNARASQPLKVKPFQYYHVSAKVKTQEFDAVGNLNILLLGKDGRALQHRILPIQRTMDWTTIDVVFNSLDQTELNFYVGVWGGSKGAIWWDDLKIEPAGWVNVVRRKGAPLTIASRNGATTYKEGVDFEPIADPKSGRVAWPGDYNVWHEAPKVKIRPGGALKVGDKLSASYAVATLIYDGQVTACLGEPETQRLIDANVAEVRDRLHPDGYMLSHDEARVGGWDASCEATKLTSGQLMAASARACCAGIAQADRGKPIYAWSDMFDPNHNAAPTGVYYLVKGQGPWSGSWEGLPASVTIFNWNSDPSKRKATLKFFADRGHKQILAGYYDGPVDAIKAWRHDALGVRSVVGAMYTTWQGDYSQLEAFSKAARESP